MLCITAALAQQYPARPIKLLVPIPPGGAPDIAARVVGQKLSEALVQPDMKEKFSNAGALEPFITTPAEFAALIRADYAKYGKVVKDIGVTLD